MRVVKSGVPLPPKPLKSQRQRVLLLNVLPIQFAEVVREFSYLEFRLWEGVKGNTKRLKELCVHADLVCGKTDYLSHSDEVVVKQYSGARYRRYRGNSRLKLLLQQEFPLRSTTHVQNSPCR